MSCSDVPAPADPRNYTPDEIVLYGVKLNGAGAEGSANIAVDLEPNSSEALRLRLHVARNNAAMTPAEVVIASVVAYSFEGHCYRLAKPKVLLFLSDRPDLAAQGCGFESTGGPLSDDSYRMWRLRAKTPLVDLDVRSGFAEEIILESNLPGKRPPSTYSLDMELAHRSGRLSKA